MSNSSSSTFYASLRRAWIERYAQRHGSVNRGDIRAAFGVSPAQASADLQGLLSAHPGCLAYDLSAKTYHWRGLALETKLPHPVASISLEL
ncbi:MAG: hypothetical protein QM680_13440 [Luteolibacter sp.]